MAGKISISNDMTMYAVSLNEKVILYTQLRILSYKN